MSDVSVLICSFDGYSDCWLPMAHSLRRYWPDCPYPIYLTSNFKDFDYPGVSLLKMGEETSWAERLRDALARLDTPYVMYFQEDYWLTEPVDTTRVTDYVAHMQRENLNYIRLLAAPPPAHDFPRDERLGFIAPEGDYRTSMQIGLWRRQVLSELLVPGESVWEFEVDGSIRSRRYGDTFLSVKPHNGDPYHWGLPYYCTAINAGRWARGVKDYAEREGLIVDFNQRPTETRWQSFQRARWGGSTAAGVLKHRLHMLLTDRAAFFEKARSRAGDVGRSRNT